MSHKFIRKILVANRGEIAIRIFRAASELKIKTVAIYTHEDRFSLHRYKADQAFQVGANNQPLKPYLDIDAIIQIALENDVDAIHPGYGFLSENENFAQKCIDNNIIWIGPRPEVMAALGNKLSAKAVAEKVGAPIVQASKEPFDSFTGVREIVNKIGLPVMLKAAVGGGGRGMRVVRKAEDLETLFREASGEARTAFGDGRVFIEKYIDDPKHIEVQILGDNYGNIVHLFERDCSVQRRFQKVVEVAPSVNLKEITRQKLHQHAVDICQSVNYSNAGTVEFLVDKEENIYFIEVNTRIQVEHTITEVITGIDLVRAQILIAAGVELSTEKLGIGKQEDIKIRGYAIQCRITTEDASQNFKPDYGRLVAYRSASGFGIRLDAGNAYAGAVISPFFDSMLVKVTAWGHRLKDAADRLERALHEFRIRGVKTNIPFLINLLQDANFRNGDITVNYIGNTPHLLMPANWKDRGTKLIRFLAERTVNGSTDIKKIDPDFIYIDAKVPDTSQDKIRKGTKDILEESGRAGLIDWIKKQDKILYTDTTFRDAHQSLLATRMRTFDMLKIAAPFAKRHGHEIFSMEVWGGATFDVSMRFLKESPWQRLKKLRKAFPNTLLQMLLRGSNAVGYKAYPDNVVREFIIEASQNGIDIFRIFDSLNWVEAMKYSIKVINEETNSIAEACICYTGNVFDENSRYNLDYYLELAKELEEAGAHMLAIKDMAGLLKPNAAAYLITALKKVTDLPIHLHTHDTSSIQSATYLKAIESGVDIVDVAISSMSGLTSQPNFNSVVAMMEDHSRNSNIDLTSLNEFSDYWERVRTYYYPFETELRAGTAEVYKHEIPGGQYSNLKPQARGLGLEDKFELIKKNYAAFNDLLGGMVKVTPSSKVVGDMAMFMTSNNYTIEDIITKGKIIDFPDSFKSLMRGDLGQRKGGWPKDLQEFALKGEEPFTKRPNDYLEPLDLEKEYAIFQEKYPAFQGRTDFVSWLLYPKVFDDYYTHHQTFGDVSKIPTKSFFFGMKPNEEIQVAISKGKNIIVQFLNNNDANERGERLSIFRLNGSIRSVFVKDKTAKVDLKRNKKATEENHIGCPLQGQLSKILVEENMSIDVGTPLFVLEAMKMESTVTSSLKGKVKKIHLAENELVEQDDLVIEIEISA
ncbi:MAG: pyruvate carboxylase [Saprospiraceae bacterium]